MMGRWHPLVSSGGESGCGRGYERGGERGVVVADGSILIKLSDDDVVGGVAHSDVARCGKEMWLTLIYT